MTVLGFLVILWTLKVNRYESYLPETGVQNSDSIFNHFSKIP